MSQNQQGSKIVVYLDVPVNDSPAMAGDDGEDDLAEEVSGERLAEAALAGDEVKEIFARLRPLHDQDEGVRSLVQVQDANDSGHVGHLSEQ